jgi:hypothetical protein
MSDKWTLYTPNDLWEDIKPVEYLVSEFLPCGTVAVLSGDGGTFKTYTMLDIAVCIAMGKPWVGRDTKQSPVLIVDEESGHDRLLRRLQETMRGHGLTKNDKPQIYFYSKNGFNADNTDHKALLKATIEKTKASFVIMDSLAVITPDSDENNTKAMRKPLDALQTIAQDTNATMGVIHHNNKMGQYRGASGIRDSIEYHFTVTRSGLTIDIKADKARDYPEEDFKLNLAAEFGTDTFMLVPADISAKHDMDARIIETIKQNPGIDKTNTLKIVGGNHTDMSNRMTYLLSVGKIKNEGKGKAHAYYVDTTEDDLLEMIEENDTNTNRYQSVPGTKAH